MKILILGGDGMLGHQLISVLSEYHKVKCTLRGNESKYVNNPEYSNENTFFNVEVTNYIRLEYVIKEFNPDVVINAVGIVKQRKSSKDSISILEVNALFPHRLAEIGDKNGFRIIHVSTDCVFDGKKGNYTEDDHMTAKDLYGMSKFLGELHDEHCLTLRTSIIGLELSRKSSLIEWFLAQSGEIKGFENAIFSGFTTKELSRIIHKMLTEYPKASGLYHVSMDPINKFDLLTTYNSFLKKEIDIDKESDFYCFRGLNSNRFRQEFNYTPPKWSESLNELAQDTKLKYGL